MVGKATARAPKANTASPPKAGAAGGAADTKRNREDQRKIAALEKSLAVEKKRNAELSKKDVEEEEDDEFQDANEDEDDADKSKEVLQVKFDELKEDVADARKKLKASKSSNRKKELEASVATGVDRLAVLQDLLFSTQHPQEQLRKKAEKTDRLRLKLPVLCSKLKETQIAIEDMRVELGKLEDKEASIRDEHKDIVEQIDKLNTESMGIASKKLVSQEGLDVGQVLQDVIQGDLKIFDNPLLAHDQTVAQKKNEFKALADAMQAQVANLMALSAANAHFLQSHVANYHDNEVKEAQRKADEAAKEAAEVTKRAADAKKKADDDAKAAKLQEAAKKDAPVPTETTPVAAAQPPVKTVDPAPKASTPVAKVRVEKSRSPVPKPGRNSEGGGSSSSSKPEKTGKTEVDAALAKPARDRTDEKALLASSTAKAAKTGEHWADLTDDMADEGQ